MLEPREWKGLFMLVMFGIWFVFGPRVAIAVATFCGMMALGVAYLKDRHDKH